MPEQPFQKKDQIKPVESREFFSEKDVEIFGKEVDKELFNYAHTILEYRDVFAEQKDISGSEDIKNWQAKFKDIDATRRKTHRKIASLFLEKTPFFSEKILFGPDLKEFQEVSREEKFYKSIEFVKKLTPIYMNLIQLIKKHKKDDAFKEFLREDVDVSEEDIDRALKELDKYSDEEIDLALEEFELGGKFGMIKRYHTAEEIKKYIGLPLAEKNAGLVIFSKKADAAIRNYCLAAKKVGEIAILTARDSENYRGGALEQADRERNYAHKKLAKALKEEGFLPEFYEGYIYDRKLWGEYNPIREIIQKYVDMYLKLRQIAEKN